MYSRNKVRTTVTPKEINPFGIQFSLQAQATTVNERPPTNKQSSDFRFVRDPSSSPYRTLSEYSDVTPHVAWRRHSQPYARDSGEGYERHSTVSYASGVSELRKAPRHRQVHHPATAYATQLTDLTPPNSGGTISPRSKAAAAAATSHQDDAANPYLQQAPRLVHSAGAAQNRHQKGTVQQMPGDKVMITESPSAPGVPIIYRSSEERSANPDRLNLDRRRLTVCPILDGEDHLRLLNFQHNSIRKIEHLSNLRRLIFLDLYDNHLEEITGLGALKSLRVLMLGKNRIRKMENLNALTKLDVLDLHGNRIEQIENLGHLVELRVLNLAGNSITHVNNLAGMEALTELNLRRNKIITLSNVDSLPNIQRLFLSFNCITSFADISCIVDAQSLSEISLDGNPLAQDINYKSIILKNVHQIRQLDMKRITEDERRLATSAIRRDEEKKKETKKLVVLKEKRRLAINNAARQWEASKSTAMAKSISLQPGPYSQSSTGWQWGTAMPDDGSSRPGSSDVYTDGSQSIDLLDDKSRVPSSASVQSAESMKSSKPPTPDLLANLSTETCHLAELDVDTLNLYGPGAIEALDKSWGVQAAGSVIAVSFKFIDFDEIAKNLHKIRIRFPNVSTVAFSECNLHGLQQLNALMSLRRLDNLTIAADGNPLTAFSLWKPYVLFRLSHIAVKRINNQEVLLEDRERAERLFAPLSQITASQLPPSRLLGLLGDHSRRNTQSLSESELKAKKQLASDQKATVENVGRAGLQYYCGDVLDGLLQEKRLRAAFSCSYVEELTADAILMNRKQIELAKIWPKMFVGMVHDAVLRMWDMAEYRRSELEAFQKYK